jgi:ATP-dependent helicase IRC3
VTYTDYEDPFNFFDSASGAPHLHAYTPYAWVGCGADVYVLELLGRGHLRVEPLPAAPGGPAFVGHYVPAALDRGTAFELKISPFMRARKVLTADDLKTAIKSCDTYVEKKVMQGPLAKGCARAASLLTLLTERPARLRRTAAWRMQPATDAQKALIRTRWKVPNAENAHPFDGSDDKREKISSMKKGEAANILTRLRHGAQVRISNLTLATLSYASL